MTSSIRSTVYNCYEEYHHQNHTYSLHYIHQPNLPKPEVLPSDLIFKMHKETLPNLLLLQDHFRFGRYRNQHANHGAKPFQGHRIVYLQSQQGRGNQLIDSCSLYQREMFKRAFTIYIPAENDENSESITKVLGLEIWTMVVQQILFGKLTFQRWATLELQGCVNPETSLFVDGSNSIFERDSRNLRITTHTENTHNKKHVVMSKRSNDHDQHRRNDDQSQGYEKKGKSVSKTLASMRFKWIKTKLDVATKIWWSLVFLHSYWGMPHP